MPITVRPVENRDIPSIQQLYSCLNTQAETLQLPLPSLSLWEKRISGLDDNSYCLVAESEGKIIGQLSFDVCKNQRRRHVGQFGMAVHDLHTGKGVGAALMSAMVDISDNWLNLRRIELTVYSDNEAALTLYQKYGFNIEGRSLEYAFKNGEYVDAYYMARVHPNLYTKK